MENSMLLGMLVGMLVGMLASRKLLTVGMLVSHKDAMNTLSHATTYITKRLRNNAGPCMPPAEPGLRRVQGVPRRRATEGTLERCIHSYRGYPGAMHTQLQRVPWSDAYTVTEGAF